VSVCDIRPERAAARAAEFGVKDHYPHIDRMLAGAPFDLLVNLTDMQEHEQLNRRAIGAGKHVWSEKPMANSLAAGQELLALARGKGLEFWGAPVVVNSPQFAYMAKTAQDGTLGRLAAAHAVYGHTGPGWSSFFYEKGGGSMPDLGVYNFTSLTGILGPARSVTAMTSIVTPTRTIDEKGEIEVRAEDNAMVLMEHASGVLSHVMCGFNYFDPHGHDAAGATRPTISVIGNKGSMHLVGYDWEPKGVDVATEGTPEHVRQCPDAGSYMWQEGASHMAECLATGKKPRITPEHALHVLEVMQAARLSQEEGRRVRLTSTFRWPVPV
jgi:predicted dehydrogenase